MFEGYINTMSRQTKTMYMLPAAKCCALADSDLRLGEARTQTFGKGGGI